ncbi:unnamed protein product, partial [Rotaria sp. Silwood1]
MVATNLCQNSVNTGPITVPNESGDEPIGIENDPSEHIGNPTDMQNPPDVSQTLTMIQNIDANQTEADKESTGMETAVNVPNTSTVVQSIDANQIEAGKESKGMETSVDVSKTLIMTGDMGIDQTKESGKPSDIQNSPDVLSIPPVSQTVVKDNYQSWVDLNFHSDSESIKKPNELSDDMKDPPGDSDSKVVNRIMGSMFGMALGDALGAHVEFRPRSYLEATPVTDLVGGGTWGLEKGQ